MGLKALPGLGLHLGVKMEQAWDRLSFHGACVENLELVCQEYVDYDLLNEEA